MSDLLSPVRVKWSFVKSALSVGAAFVVIMFIVRFYNVSNSQSDCSTSKCSDAGDVVSVKSGTEHQIRDPARLIVKQTLGGTASSKHSPIVTVPCPSAIHVENVESLIEKIPDGLSPRDYAQQASDMNNVMDEMLNRSEIPADYGSSMIAIFRDRSNGDVIRDFAVQHIGLYAETLNMRGKYDAGSRESAALRDALWDASDETRTIVAAAAFRALADMAAFDPHVDVRRLNSRLAECAADASASPAARVMAAQICRERGVSAVR